MFSVLFEVRPRSEEWNTYLDSAKMLKPELEQIAGFVDNIRYRSITRDGWILSLSNWRDEKALVRWHTRARHHEVQAKGRDRILGDYHLRVGQVTADNDLPAGQQLQEQRLDETETGVGTAVTLLNLTKPRDQVKAASAEDCAAWFGFDPETVGLVDWDVFDAVLTPGQLILVATWRDHPAAERFRIARTVPAGTRVREVRVVRDYGMVDRYEAPQYYPEISKD
ncbi:antibiotic biosynthesis monooxygenase [Kribbella sp. NPDC049584]|uniref:antibiotic biosynthesis monooxygenase family protein n=1 Tax=Kribbella sp. NPDC049584 TaxID=3154833 RepID=UPI0034252CC6